MPNKFNYVKRGYDPAEVDAYISSLEEVLRSYKDKDSAIKNAIISAQLAAEEIKRGARVEAEDRKRQAYAKLGALQQSITQQRDLIRSFEGKFSALLAEFAESAKKHDFSEVYAQVDSIEQFLNKLTETGRDAPQAAESPQKINFGGEPKGEPAYRPLAHELFPAAEPPYKPDFSRDSGYAKPRYTPDEPEGADNAAPDGQDDPSERYQLERRRQLEAQDEY
ncbi:MAG: DivIVA domain-containing protein [Clostridiales bacterium]|jgi:hypothetical protein|nr:DivIVA domain-containing protein [Clostridiales bacterium]